MNERFRCETDGNYRQWWYTVLRPWERERRQLVPASAPAVPRRLIADAEKCEISYNRRSSRRREILNLSIPLGPQFSLSISLVPPNLVPRISSCFPSESPRSATAARSLNKSASRRGFRLFGNSRCSDFACARLTARYMFVPPSNRLMFRVDSYFIPFNIPPSDYDRCNETLRLRHDNACWIAHFTAIPSLLKCLKRTK